MEIKPGKTILRSNRDMLKSNEYHLCIHVCLLNSKGKMLIQKRKNDKKDDPGKWDFSARGSVLKDETSQEGAKREVLEELGLVVDFTDRKPDFTNKPPNVIDDYYIITMDIELNNVIIQEEELDRVMWASKEEIIEMMNNGEFVHYSKNTINSIFKLKIK